MLLKQLQSPALAISTAGKHSWLAPDSIVGVIDVDAEVYQQSPVADGEPMVGYINAKGKFVPGWIASTVKLKTTREKPALVVPDADDKQHPWDELRQDLSESGTHFSEMTSLAWWSARKNLLARIVREFGGRSPSDSVQDLVQKIAQFTGATAPLLEERTVKDKSSKKEKAASTKKSSSKEKGAPARMFSRTVGNHIAMVCALAGVSTPKVAKRLQNDEQPSKKELIALRDEINETNAKLRDGSKTQQVCALALAHVNMGVQRLSRSGK